MDESEKTVWTAKFRREQLIELLDGRGPRPSRDVVGSFHRNLTGGEILGIWTARDHQDLAPLPHVIVAEEKTLQDLIAWCSSYLRELGPLSAIARLLTVEQFEATIRRIEPSAPWKLAGGAVSLVVCEILALGGDISLEQAVVARPSSTLSFSLLRAWSQGYTPRTLAEIAAGYYRLPRTTHAPSFEQVSRAVVDVVSSMLGLDLDEYSSGSIAARRSMNDLRSGYSPYQVAREIFRQSADLLSAGDIADLEHATAEQRVRLFDIMAPSLIAMGAGRSRLDTAFALAVAAFICRPGLQQQASLLSEYAIEFPESWLWLGALQTFAPLADVLSMGSGAGWRIGREMYRAESIFTMPSADVALLEIDVLSKSRSKALQRLLSRSRLEVEIYPMIVATIRGEASELEGGLSYQGTLRPSAIQEYGSVRQLGYLEAQLQNSLRIVREMRGGDASARSGKRRR